MSKVFLLKNYSNYIAVKTLNELEQDVTAYRKKNPTEDIILDFSNTQMQNSHLMKVASICEYFDCACVGLGDRYETIKHIQQTGYFITQHMGHQKYLAKFRRLIEQADYTLLIWEQRKGSYLVPRLVVIQPIIFTDTHFVFQELNAKYSQPRQLQEAVSNGALDIYKRHEVHITDMASEDYCFRFANNIQERTILDVLFGIMTKQIPKEFFEGVAK